jgi:hypothetical protein
MTAPMKVRYSKVSGMIDWIPCQWAVAQDGVLVIKLGNGGQQDMVPLHVIPGPIEVRPNKDSDQ